MLLTIYPACLQPKPEPPLSSVDAGLFVPVLSIVPLKLIEYGVNGVLISIPKAIFYLLKGDYREITGKHLWDCTRSGDWESKQETTT